MCVPRPGLLLLLLTSPLTLAYNVNVNKLTLRPAANAKLFGWSLQHFQVGLLVASSVMSYYIFFFFLLFVGGGGGEHEEGQTQLKRM